MVDCRARLVSKQISNEECKGCTKHWEKKTYYTTLTIIATKPLMISLNITLKKKKFVLAR